MRYLDDTKLWDKIEYVVGCLIFGGLFIAAIITFSTDIFEATFYIFLATIIAPFVKINPILRRYLLISGFIFGLVMGYFS